MGMVGFSALVEALHAQPGGVEGYVWPDLGVLRVHTQEGEDDMAWIWTSPQHTVRLWVSRSTCAVRLPTQVPPNTAALNTMLAQIEAMATIGLRAPSRPSHPHLRLVVDNRA